ncbi:MAG: DNA-processing protein DprA [Epsilonproteobacteria bacterium]|nr:DNA-processing protein DprA [Campylobacterota bacterium]
MNNVKQEYAYWMVLAHLHLPKMKTARKNKLIVKCFEEKLSIVDFFHCAISDWNELFLLNENEIKLLNDAKKELPNYSFLVEDLLEQGYDIIPITSPDYSPIMKNNLKRAYSPPLIYTKGNKRIMKENSIAIVGSRKAEDISLRFTDNVAKAASKDYKVVVSGFAKGVDKQALDSAIKYKGQSIIVLPQGITTFKSGFRKYYKQIVDGDVLVLSTFFPRAPWSVQLAMARNPIIYGLSKEIYVAESSEKGGTWSGVIDGLRKGRTVFVRIPLSSEKNANNLLIQKGAIPVDSQGNKIENYSISKIKESVVNESSPTYNDIDLRIIKLLSFGTFTSEEIIERLKIDWTSGKLTNYLKQNQSVKVLNKESPIKFTIKRKEDLQQSLL